MTPTTQKANPPKAAKAAPSAPESASSQPAPAFGALTASECESVLQRNNVGRLAFSLHDRVNVLPVHYRYAEGWLYGRTAPGGKLLQILRNRWIAFEVDEQHGIFDWHSVVVHGALYVINPGRNTHEHQIYDRAIDLLRDLIPSTLGPGDPIPFRDQFFRIHAAEITGRFSISHGGEPIAPASELHQEDQADAITDIALRDEVLGVTAPFVHSSGAEMQVETYDGVVVLTGTVNDPRDRVAIEGAVAGLPGVHALVQQLDTDWPPAAQQGPAEQAKTALRELRSAPLPEGSSVTVVVDHGWLRAEGYVPSGAARDEILRRLGGVRGTRGLIDRLAIRSVGP